MPGDRPAQPHESEKTLTSFHASPAAGASAAAGQLRFHPAADCFPLMEGEEFEALILDIQEYGLNEPIVLDAEGRILDGRNRYRACLATDTTPRFVTFRGDDPLAFVMSENLRRRHLTATQRALVGTSLLPLLEERARERQGTRTDLDFPAKLPEGAGGEAREHAARIVNVGARYISDAKAIVNAAPELAEPMSRGELTLQQARRKVKRAEVIERLEDVAAVEAKAIAGVYDVVVIDPPWPIAKIERDERPNQVVLDYPTMTEDELRALAVPCAEPSHVWLWTTQKYLPTAFRLLDAWGLTYVCTFVWHKPGGFQPFGLPQYNCEFALYARRGAPAFVDLKALPTCFSAPRGRHSEKPDEFYDLVRRVTAGRRLDMFGRRAIPGFDSWGKEAVSA